MSKNNEKLSQKQQKKAEAKKPEVKKEEKKQQPKKAPEVPPAIKQEEVKPAASQVLTREQINKTIGGGLSPDGRMIWAKIANDRYFLNPNKDMQYAPEFLKGMNLLIDAVMVTEMVDEAMFGTGTLTRVLDSTMLPHLIAVANMMGVEVPNIKVLEAKTPDDLKKQGKVVVEISKKNISKETQEAAKKEQKVKAEVPELDPVKVFAQGEEALKKAITYKLVTVSGVSEKLTGVVDFMRLYRAEEARHAENTADAMQKFDNRTVGEWLDDAFKIATPTLLFKGIGTGLRLSISATKSPVSAFTILKRHIKDQWDDASTASAVTAIIRWITNDAIEANEKDIALLPEKERDGEIAAKYKEAIQHNKDILDWTVNATYDFVEKITESDSEKLTDTEKKFRESLQKFLYPDLKPGTYKNLLTNMQQYAGYVTGLFRETGTADANYALSNMTELQAVEEPSVEEKKEEVKKD